MSPSALALDWTIVIAALLIAAVSLCLSIFGSPLGSGKRNWGRLFAGLAIAGFLTGFTPAWRNLEHYYALPRSPAGAVGPVILDLMTGMPRADSSERREPRHGGDRHGSSIDRPFRGAVVGETQQQPSLPAVVAAGDAPSDRAAIVSLSPGLIVLPPCCQSSERRSAEQQTSPTTAACCTRPEVALARELEDLV